MLIIKGQKFECIKDVLGWEGSKAVYYYVKGGIYVSEHDNCITDSTGDCHHEWDNINKFEEHFKPFTECNEDNVNHPKHYTSHPSGIECITITRHYCFSIGNAIKYLWRAGLKKDASLEDKQKEIEDLKKSIWYINDRINQLENDKT